MWYNNNCIKTNTHYTALVNDGRTRTYEFRIFNSNLKLDRILKNYECVLALLDYTKQHQDIDHPYCNTQDFINYVLENPFIYRNLYNFFIERKIKEHYGITYTDLELEAA